MAKTKLKTYELYDGSNGHTVRSVFYGRISKRITKVLAHSAEQAIMLANKNILSDGEKIGIIEIM